MIFARVNASVAQAAPEDAFAARVAREARLFVEPGAWGGVSRLRMLYERWLLVLLTLLAAVMLLACLNVATLLLARSEARKIEIATRLAIGAGRWRVVRQLMTESLMIAIISGVLGLALSWWASLYLLRIALPSDGTLPIDLSPDARAIGFTILMSVVTSVLFGLMPALRATARMPRSAGRGPRGPRKRWLERSLVGAQSALSLVLVVFAALFVRTLQNLWTLDPGYDRTNVVMFSIDAGLAGKRGPERTRTYQSVLDAVGAMPGATSVSASVVAPVSTSYYFGTLVTQAGATAFPDERRLEIAYNLTAPGYFATLRIPLLAGRDFDARDRIGSPAVAIVSEQLAARFAGNPIGQRLVTADGEYERDRCRQRHAIREHQGRTERCRIFRDAAVTKHRICANRCGPPRGIGLRRGPLGPRSCGERRRGPDPVPDHDTRGPHARVAVARAVAGPAQRLRRRLCPAARVHRPVWVDDVQSHSADARAWPAHGTRHRLPQPFAASC